MRNSINYFVGKEGRFSSRIYVLLAMGFAMTLLAACGGQTASADLNSAKSPAEAAVKTEALNLAPSHLTIPEGTAISARLLQSISSSSAQPGDSFDAELATALTVDGKVVFPRGAKILGSVVSAANSGRLQHPSKLSLTLKAIQSPDGKWIDVKSSNFRVQGQSHKNRNLTLIGGGTGLGALIGGIAGGGKGLAIGALSGAAAGTAGAAATGEKDVTLSVERTLRFTLKSPVTVIQ